MIFFLYLFMVDNFLSLLVSNEIMVGCKAFFTLSEKQGQILGIVMPQMM